MTGDECGEKPSRKFAKEDFLPSRPPFMNNRLIQLILAVMTDSRYAFDGIMIFCRINLGFNYEG